MLQIFELATKVPQLLGTTSGEVASRLPEIAKDLRSSSLIERSAAARVSSQTIVDASLLKNPNLSSILKVLNQQIAIYYLQALSMQMMHQDVRIASILDSLNPNRSVGDSIAMGLGALAAGNNAHLFDDIESQLPERWKDGLSLPKSGEKVHPGIMSKTNSLYASHFLSVSAGLNADVPEAPEPEPMPSSGLHKDTIHTLTTMQNLAVGQVLDVKFKTRDSEITIPIQVSLQPVNTAPDTIVALMSHAEADISFPERLWQWRNGLITGTQFATGSDLIDEHARILKADKTGVYQEMLKRKKRNKLSGFISGVVTLMKGVRGRASGLSGATASEIYVIDKATADAFELKIGAKLSDFKTRSRIFVNSYIMMMAVYDPSWDTVTIYHRGIPQPTELDISDVKAISKSAAGGSDMIEQLKAYQSGQMMGQPRF